MKFTAATSIANVKNPPGARLNIATPSILPARIGMLKSVPLPINSYVIRNYLT